MIGELRTIIKQAQVGFRADLLVVEHYIREPEVFGGYTEFFDAIILLWVPSQPVVVPLLHR